MIEKLFLQNQRIIGFLDTYYGIKVSVLTLLTLGADMHNSIYKAEALNGQAYFVKLKRGYQAGGEKRAASYQHFLAQFEFNGVVDIAFATAKKY